MAHIEFFHYQLGVPNVGFVLETCCCYRDDAVEALDLFLVADIVAYCGRFDLERASKHLTEPLIFFRISLMMKTHDGIHTPTTVRYLALRTDATDSRARRTRPPET